MFGEYVTALGGDLRDIWGDELLPLLDRLLANPYIWACGGIFLLGAYFLMKK